jgi:hypothetical protein
LGQYYVILPDGQRYGPASVAQLNQWILEGRVVASNHVEEVLSKRQYPVTQVPGIQFPGSQNPYQPQGVYAPPGSNTYSQAPSPSYPSLNQPNPYRSSPSDGGQGALVFSYLCSGFSLLTLFSAFIPGAAGFMCCCFPVPVLGVIFGYRAQNAGHLQGSGAVTLSWVALVLSLLGMFILGRLATGL